MTAISDGDPALPALVRSATAGPVQPVLDWFHLSMRVHHVEQVMHGLCALEPPPLAPLEQAQIDVERLRHLLWNSTLPVSRDREVRLGPRTLARRR